MLRRFIALMLPLVVLHAAAAAIATTERVHVPPIFSLSDLQNGRRSSELARVLRTTGLLQVSLDADNARGPSALEHLCQCSPVLSGVPGTDTVVLAADAQTTRTTLGTATIGRQPLPLPQELTQVCGTDAALQLETIRDDVAVAGETFSAALDRLLSEAMNQSGSSSFLARSTLLRTTNGQSYGSIHEISQVANNLEHFHVYTKTDTILKTPISSDEQELALDWHTDAGLFLAFVHAHGCDANDGAVDKSFYIMDPTDGQPKRVAFDPSSIAIMLGTGAEHWLYTSMTLRASRHAVQMQPGQSRAWYGMMYLVPENAIIQSSPERTFGDMKQNMRYRKDQVHASSDIVSIGCGHENVADLIASNSSVTFDSTMRMERRRLQHVQNADACNNSTNFFCWMQCLEIPKFKQAQGYINEGYSLYCLDPATLASSSNRVSAATEPCENGLVHNPYCTGSWQPTAPGVTAIPVVTSSSGTSTTDNEQWCYGATSMYMDGFHWRNSVCIIYLFPQWILSTPGRVVGASIGTLAFGVALEKTIHHRRIVVTSMGPGYSRLATSAFLYAFQLTMGYLLMLIIMTYSGPLFVCVVFGLVGGHVLFNAKDALLVPKSNSDVCLVKECAEECPQECRLEEDVGMIKCCPCERIEEEQQAGVPEGITPCCQNTL